MDCLEASRCVKRPPWELSWCTGTVRPTQSVATNSSKARPFPVLLQTKDENYHPGVCKKFTQINSPQCVWNLRFPWPGSFPVHHSESSLGGKNYIGLWNPINELLEMMHYLCFWISFPQKSPVHPDHWQASRCVSPKSPKNPWFGASHALSDATHSLNVLLLAQTMPEQHQSWWEPRQWMTR